MAQTWHDLRFAHWPVPGLHELIPPQLELDTLDGEGWIGVIPFRMDGIYARGTFPLPWLSASPEINVRTYVKFGGKRGVYFFSLDAANRIAVKVARRFFHLPYIQAAMSVRNDNDKVHYSTSRVSAEFRASYRPMGGIKPAAPGTLEHWLTERYCFYTLDRAGRVIRGDIDHAPWPLQPAEASIDINSMTEPLGIRLPKTPPLLHFSRRIDVKVWMPERA